MSEPASISSGIAERYAAAVFEIAQENNALSELEGSLEGLSAALADSEDLRNLIHSPLISRDEQGAAIAAVAQKMGVQDVLVNVLSLMAQKRRLFVLPQLIEHLQAMIAEHKGEVTADVTTAKALTKTQSEKLAKTLAARIGKDVKINATVDESLVGGLVVKVGSKMIDTSIRSKLASLQNAMKEVG
ncbi:F0F1 ATP synthase subunit delta [Shimia sp. R11_0]|uniref:ATP synthase subunit delta n=1 Tax=Shimia marina TaxID=321267 RepID=A0A0P1EQ93_9RHOB|nr:F0F1 ATP synthase subunit delta [Shimia marina]MBO9478817.1 F0F1 ATP synthase subunit delta [Shimia sp. R11_0]CUH52349.1 F-type ATPase subunit delta [Shimia marina]SFE09488.1 ATP synthase F1 subcomplex delta subunit [Shimia marina]